MVSAGREHSCGLRETGAVECWGYNYSGQTDAPAGRFSAVSAGGWHTCGLRETGAVECWGYNEDGRADAPAGRFSAVSVGGRHTCGLRETGAVECWGYNYSGQADAPAGRFSAVSAGWSHTCGLRETGAVECWGYNGEGQTDVPEDLAVPAEPAEAGCPEDPPQLFHVTETTSTTPTTLTRSAHLDTECQVDGLSASRVRPADRYEFTLDRPASVSAKLISDTFAPHLFLTDADGTYFYRVGTEQEGGTWFSLSESRAASGEGSAIIRQAGGAVGGLRPAAFGLRLEPGTYWLFAVSESGPQTGDYQLEVAWERISDSGMHQQIVERFAPVILFEEGEQYFPVPVDLMIQHSTLLYTRNGRWRARLPGTYRLTDLISYNGQDSYLDLADEERESRGEQGERVVYARVAETYGANAGVLVQYWFFYLYNATGVGKFNHEGDWEGVQLWFAGLSPDDLLTANVPTQLGYAAHESGWAFIQNAESCAEFNGSLWPSVYVARNRHASYIEASGGGPIAQWAQSRYGLSLDKSFDKQDQFQGNGEVWALQGLDVADVEGELGYEIRMLPTDPNQSWLAWTGRWGDTESGSGGPRGPAFKPHFWLPPMRNGWSQAEFECRAR